MKKVWWNVARNAIKALPTEKIALKNAKGQGWCPWRRATPRLSTLTKQDERGNNNDNKTLADIDESISKTLRTSVPDNFKPQLEYLIGIGVSTIDLTRIVLKDMSKSNAYPSKLTLRRQELKNKVDYVLQQLDLEGWQIGKILRSAPEMVLAKTDTLQSCIDYFCQEGFSIEDISKMYLRSSRLFSLNPKNTIEPRVEFLKDLLRHETDLVHKIIIKVPAVLESKPEIIQRTFRTLDEYGFGQEETLYIFCNHPQTMRYSAESLTGKMKCLEDLGFSREHVIEIFAKTPKLFGLSVEKNLKPTCIFLLQTVGWDSMTIARMPSILMSSLEGRIIPRYSFIKTRENIDQDAILRKREWLMCTNDHFVHKICCAEEVDWLKHFYSYVSGKDDDLDCIDKIPL